jgi:hypothetical protein
MKVKELFENEELMESIVEDITDIPEDTEVTYEVWALGYDKNDNVTDAEMLIGEFANPDEAVACAEKLTLADIVFNDDSDDCELKVPLGYISVEVETVVPDEEDSTMNVGTVYKRDLWLDGEYGSEDCLEVCLDEAAEDLDPIVAITSDDYELLEDGTLKVSCGLLKDFNKNDCLRLQFVGEPESVPIITYKIISKVEYKDGDYYHLDFMY